MRSSSAWPDRCRAGALALAVALLPDAALAHSPIPGIKGFYIGFVHPLTSAAQILAFGAMGLVLGQRWPRGVDIAMGVFAGACLAGIILGQNGVPVSSAEPGLLALALLAGALGALWPASPIALPIIAAGIAGLLIGLVSTPDDGPLRSTIITLTGSFAGANVVMLYAAGGIGWVYERATMPWARIGFRIAAAWIAAIAALLLALVLASPA